MEAIKEPWISVEEYLRIEESSSVRHEYVDGVLFAMVGEKLRHNAITVNLVSRLHAAAGSGSCRAFVNNIKVMVANDKIYYPDIVVTCDPGDIGPLIVHNPCLIIEVLSPSTQATDRREKLTAYRGIATLLSYLMVSQDEPRVDRYWRDSPGDTWKAQVVIEGSIAMPCPPCDIAIADIYANLPPIRE
jgi:Uma2 family endonuclease